MYNPKVKRNSQLFSLRNHITKELAIRVLILIYKAVHTFRSAATPYS